MTWLHTQWLWLLATPLPVYLDNPLTMEGVIVPSVVSLFLGISEWRQVKDRQIIIGFLLFAVTMGLFTQYWGQTGLHLFTGGFIIWPVLALLMGDKFPWPMAYPLAFIGTIIPDLYGAGMAAGWHQGWYFGVGGAGFHDGDFIFPLETVIAAAAMYYFGNLMRKRGFFKSEL